ncbi:hypothetical protein TNCV_2104431 [Trichonephila clavipes]|nr:hypothetical protein TNCV_2104431 [Trichonephila clavipes]
MLVYVDQRSDKDSKFYLGISTRHFGELSSQGKVSTTWRQFIGLGSGECGQHLCPPEKRRVFRKGPVKHEFYVDVSGDSRVQWSDETRKLLYVLAIWEDL